MLDGPRMIAAAAVALFLSALFYVGYVNELLKGAISPPHRAVIVIGFIIGAAAASRYIAAIAGKCLAKKKRAPR